jgi:hypothetical protein
VLPKAEEAKPKKIKILAGEGTKSSIAPSKVRAAS